MNEITELYSECVDLIMLYGRINRTSYSDSRFDFPSRLLVPHIEYAINLECKTIYYKEKEFESEFLIIDYTIHENRSCSKMKFENNISFSNARSEERRSSTDIKPQIILNEIKTSIENCNKEKTLKDKLNYSFESYLQSIFSELLYETKTTSGHSFHKDSDNIKKRKKENFYEECLMFKQKKVEMKLSFIPTSFKLFRYMGFYSINDVIIFLSNNNTLRSIKESKLIQELNIEISLKQITPDIYLIIK